MRVPAGMTKGGAGVGAFDAAWFAPPGEGLGVLLAEALLEFALFAGALDFWHASRKLRTNKVTTWTLRIDFTPTSQAGDTLDGPFGLFIAAR
jgi:hypothetical protein